MTRTWAENVYHKNKKNAPVQIITIRQPLMSQAETHVPRGIRLRLVYRFSSVAQAVTPAMSVKPTDISPHVLVSIYSRIKAH